MVEMAENCWKRLKTVENSWKQFKMVENGYFSKCSSRVSEFPRGAKGMRKGSGRWAEGERKGTLLTPHYAQKDAAADLNLDHSIMKGEA